MRKERISVYITQRQKQQLGERSQKEHLPEAEIIRRALDAYLAWDDPTYTPDPSRPEEEPFIPALKRRGFLARSW